MLLIYQDQWVAGKRSSGPRHRRIFLRCDQPVLSLYGGGNYLAVGWITVEVWQFCRSDSDLTIHWNLNQVLFDERPAQRFDRTHLL